MEIFFKTFIYIFRFFIKPKEKYICYHSFPDLSDNSFSLFVYVANKYINYTNIWLVSELNTNFHKKKIANYTNSKHFKIVKKKSLLGIYFFCKSKYIFHTHGVFNEIPLQKEQINVNLWHGMPLKRIGHLDNNNRVPKSDYVISTSLLFQKIMSKAFDIVKSKVLNTGQPRNDFLFEDKFKLSDLVTGINIDDYSKTILWMPTYRKSIKGDIRVDSDLEKASDFLSTAYLEELNIFLKSANFICFVKLHPMDFMSVDDFGNHTNIKFLDNTPFLEKGISLYSVMNRTDLLITDFSSIYIDYLLLNKPILFLIPDFETYQNSRGFVFDNPKTYMPGEIITNKVNFIPYLEKILINNEDNYFKEREYVRQVFHNTDQEFSKTVFNSVLK
ncbi:CDP-glycerol glycerophosphotransferase family protein [uncultured Polaribacter sp.]|uniref:CDP-glycerol glycerophosphotransferase family protein n=1 Tax=uncultured Polaribacter sp. TaxID=174711 RepID=UPI0026127C62|nr:CDP-glycerol glycerophosphotransferase family protein [uncultured Polaribacter sp.]